MSLPVLFVNPENSRLGSRPRPFCRNRRKIDQRISLLIVLFVFSCILNYSQFHSTEHADRWGPTLGSTEQSGG